MRSLLFWNVGDDAVQANSICRSYVVLWNTHRYYLASSIVTGGGRAGVDIAVAGNGCLVYLNTELFVQSSKPKSKPKRMSQRKMFARRVADMAIHA